jgi:hypothetical protein
MLPLTSPKNSYTIPSPLRSPVVRTGRRGAGDELASLFSLLNRSA